jgi:ABC-type transport system involved in multi-copper enzyme maturation permease subunit
MIFKEPRFLLPFLIMPLLIMGLQVFTIIYPLGEVQQNLALARTLLLILAVLAPSSAVPLGADSFAGEKERNTLETLMCLPVGLGSLFWGKVLGMIPVPVLIGLFGQAVMASILKWRGFWTPEFGGQVAKAMLLTPALGLFLCALATLLSLLSESVRSAAQFASIAMLALFFLVTSFSQAFYDSGLVFACVIGFLLASSTAFFLVARRRFPRLV